MKKSNKKGFTIVELVIVIAVIAILAAVLIPTFASIVKKANLSADQQAVRQMNTILTSYDTDGSIKTVADAVKVLDENNIDLKDYKALTKNHFFFFVADASGNGRIILANDKSEIIYPQDFKAKEGAQWMSLSGMVPMSDDYTIKDGKVTIDDGAKLVHLMEQVKSNKSSVTEITLSGDIDLKGAAVDFGEVNTPVVLKGAGSGKTTLSGLRADDNTVSPTTGDYSGHLYGYGIFGSIEKDVTIEGITIKNLVVGNSNDSHEEGANTTGLIAGYIRKGATLTMKDVVIEGCTVNAFQKAGAIVGQLGKSSSEIGKLVMENVDIKDTTINGYTEVAKIAGVAWNGSSLSADSDCDFSGITVNGKADKVVKASQISIENTTLSGSKNNTFVVSPSTKGDKTLFGLATSDWAWYNPYTGTRPTATVDGTEMDWLNGFTGSIASNFTNLNK